MVSVPLRGHTRFGCKVSGGQADIEWTRDGGKFSNTNSYEYKGDFIELRDATIHVRFYSTKSYPFIYTFVVNTGCWDLLLHSKRTRWTEKNCFHSSQSSISIRDSLLWKAYSANWEGIWDRTDLCCDWRASIKSSLVQRWTNSEFYKKLKKRISESRVKTYVGDS